MGLASYHKKRTFNKTPEPKGKAERKSRKGRLSFVVQRHEARQLHYDFRLELDGVLLSWAVPKGPSLNPSDKRLAMMVEDHPLDYRTFEGVIPEGNYGAGTVMVWDEGIYRSIYDEKGKNSSEHIRKGLKEGHITFILEGKKLNGEFALVRLKRGGENAWLLIKADKDEFAGSYDVIKQDRSVITGRTMSEIRRKSLAEDKVWDEKHRAMNKAPKAKMPHNVHPQLATLTLQPFDDKDFLFEVKWDGYRAIAEIDDGDVKLYSRNLTNFNKKYPDIVDSLKKIKGSVVVDGEMVCLDEDGVSRFELLQNYELTGEGNLVYYVFDLLYADGKDLSGLPLIERKSALEEFLPKLPNVRFSDHILEKGTEFYKEAKKQGVEGIIAKRITGPYQERRTRDWLKIKIHQEQEAIICGFTEGRAGRKGFGALVLGSYKDGQLVYIGHVGTGFDERKIKFLLDKMRPLAQPESPFKQAPKTNMPVTWVKPKLVCEIRFQEWTDDGIMRQPVFLGLRDDKAAKEVEKEEPVVNAEETMIKSGKINVPITHPDKTFFPELGLRKIDLVHYYKEVSKIILPHLIDRPESLNRFPDGIHGESFYHKDVEHHPSWVKSKKIFSDSNQDTIEYLLCQDEASLLYLINLGCIELNPWNSRVGSLDKPDFMIIDLDPEDIGFDKVIEAALATRKVLDRLEIESYVKTSGATGMHIYVPIAAKYSYDQVRDFSEILVNLIKREVPEFTSLERKPAKRQGKVYLDYLQNSKGQTLASPYSVRPRAEATVSTPLKWDEVKRGLDPKDYDYKTIFTRLDRYGDLWKGAWKKAVDIKKVLARIESMGGGK